MTIELIPIPPNPVFDFERQFLRGDEHGRLLR